VRSRLDGCDFGSAGPRGARSQATGDALYRLQAGGDALYRSQVTG
jgi:hypothetical protein